MNCNPSLGILADGKETLDNAIIWGSAINEEQILVVEASIRELLGFVHTLVETNNGGDSVGAEVVEVVVGGVQGVAILDPALVVGASKGEELPCDEVGRKRGV